MTTLITGGGSRTGTRLAKLLQAQPGRKVIFASRSGRIPEGFTESVKLDWEDPTTFENPFKGHGPIESVYLLGRPSDMRPDKSLGPFIDLAVEKGVKRFVYLSSSGDKEKNVVGDAHVPAYLEQKGLDYVSLRPTWFDENFSQAHLPTILASNQFTTCVPTGRTPFVAVDDIAQAAYEAITRQENKLKDLVVVGPELLNYNEVAAIASDVLGRQITHNAISPEEFVKALSAVLTPAYAQGIVDLYVGCEAGDQEQFLSLTSSDQEKLGVAVYVGKVTVREWFETNKSVFNA